MCGIVGGVAHYSSKTFDFLDALFRLRHRGPDDQGLWSDEHVCLGHVRLSILDLSPSGHQPMTYQNARFCITFNGEIYNYVELRHELQHKGYQFTSRTDTEVLLAAYAEWGRDCLERLRGMFAFGIWDREENSLFLARDRVGEKPLYYWYNDNCLYFASELKVLISLLPSLPPLEPSSLDLYMHYQYVPEPLTPFSKVFKLPPAHYLLIKKDRWQIHPKRYWSLEQIKPLNGDPGQMIRQELERVIELTLRSDVPIGVALSGGIDSTAITALASAKYKERLQAFSVGYPGQPHYDEREQARTFAKHLDIPFYELELRTEILEEFFPELVRILDEPIADIAAYGHYSVMRLASEKGVKVMLTGIGGDELFWGYPYLQHVVHLTQKKYQLLHKFPLPSWMWSGLRRITDHSIFQGFAQDSKYPERLRSWLCKGFAIEHLSLDHPQQSVFYDIRPNFTKALCYRDKIYSKNFAARLPDRNPFLPFEIDWRTEQEIPVQICQILFDTWLVSNCLSLGDRVSMASSVETRLPLLDYKFIELVIGLRQTFPDHNLKHKFWLHDALRDLVPEEVFLRPKRGFQPPVQQWMHTLIKRYMNWLQAGCLVEMNIINPSYLRKMLEEFTTKHQHTFILYKMLLLEVWYQKIALKGQ